MSNEYRRIEVITGEVRRRRWTTEQKLQIIEESFEVGETVSSTARRHGVAPNLLYRWRRLLSEGGAAAVDSDEPVVGNSEVKKLEERVRELERMLGNMEPKACSNGPSEREIAWISKTGYNLVPRGDVAFSSNSATRSGGANDDSGLDDWCHAI
jgi:transposase